MVSPVLSLLPSVEVLGYNYPGSGGGSSPSLTTKRGRDRVCYRHDPRQHSTTPTSG
jgi:hypothetical protein